jgi:hypothetical protein
LSFSGANHQWSAEDFSRPRSKYCRLMQLCSSWLECSITFARLSWFEEVIWSRNCWGPSAQMVLVYEEPQSSIRVLDCGAFLNQRSWNGLWQPETVGDIHHFPSREKSKMPCGPFHPAFPRVWK